MNKILSAAALLLLAACGSQPLLNGNQSSNTNDPLMDLVNNRTGQNTAATARPVNGEAPFFNQPAASVNQGGYLANPNVQAFIRYHSQYSGLDAYYLQSFFSQAGYRGNIIDIMNRPGTSRPWYAFAKDNSGAARINGGRRFYQNNRDAIDRAAARYGVPAELIVAIIGIETGYGSNMGSIRTGDALATLAFDYPRRGHFFQKELAEFLKLAHEEGRDPLSFTGSYAGAMGMPQFMPSSFRKWAADGNGDGRRDIWSNPYDVAASVANYMKVHGWQTGKPMIVPVALNPTPQLLAIIEEKTALTRTVGQLRQHGVQPAFALSDNEKAVLFRLETAPGRYEYFIGLNNFYTVWQYNNSRMYVTAVRNIANGIGNGGL